MSGKWKVTSVKEEVAKEMKDWKTYRNEEYGFDFKYPSDYHTDIEHGDSDFRVTITGPEFFGDSVLVRMSTRVPDTCDRSFAPTVTGIERRVINENDYTYVTPLATTNNYAQYSVWHGKGCYEVTLMNDNKKDSDSISPKELGLFEEIAGTLKLF